MNISLVEEMDVSFEWLHNISIVVLDDTSEEWNRALYLRRCNEAENANHCQTAVVHFFDKAFCLLLIGLLRGKSERVVEVKRNWVRDLHVLVVHKRWESSWLTTLHVMSVTCRLAPEFEECNQ
jgi:hypothetical protein